MSLNVLGLMFGAAFGFLIAAAGFNRYETIHDGLLFRDPQMFLVMGAAVTTAAPILYLLQRRGVQTPLGGRLALPRARIERRHVLGSVVFGVGWAITASCPAPALAMVGSGGLLGIVVVAGIFAGLALRQHAAERGVARSARPAAGSDPLLSRPRLVGPEII